MIYMLVPNSKVWMRSRERSIKGVKVNNKKSDNDLSCRYCKDDSQESQEHIETCEGCMFERRGLDMSDWKGVVIFWRRMSAKINAASA